MLKLVIDIESRHPTGGTKGSTRITKTTKRKAPTQADNLAATSYKKKQREFLTEATRLGISSQLISLK